jgi:hypothetical protein
VCSSEIRAISILHFGVTGGKMEIKSVEDVEFHLNDINYPYKFCLFSSNGRHGITAVFLSETNSKLDLEKEELPFFKFPNYNRGSLD